MIDIGSRSAHPAGCWRSSRPRGHQQPGHHDTAKGRLVEKVPVGSTPMQMYSTPDASRVYVAHQGTARSLADTVSVVDPRAGKVTATIRTGKAAHGVAISKDGRYVFVTIIEAAPLSVIDTASNKAVAAHRVGRARKV